MGNVGRSDAALDNGRNQDPPRRRSTSASENELADVCARFAEVCDYFSRKNIDLPPHVLEQIGKVAKLAIPDRIARINQLNGELMEYLYAADQDSGIRH